MEEYIKGIYKQSIYKGDNGYLIGLIKVFDTNIPDMKDYVNKTITFTGNFAPIP